MPTERQTAHAETSAALITLTLTDGGTCEAQALAPAPASAAATRGNGPLFWAIPVTLTGRELTGALLVAERGNAEVPISNNARLLVTSMQRGVVVKTFDQLAVGDTFYLPGRSVEDGQVQGGVIAHIPPASERDAQKRQQRGHGRGFETVRRVDLVAGMSVWQNVEGSYSVIPAVAGQAAAAA